MMDYIFSVTGISFLIGAAAVAAINKKKETSSHKERWIKYFAYLAIVLVMGAAIIAGHFYFIAIAALISVAGFYEIVNVGLRSGRSLSLISKAVITYMLITFCFLGFAVFAAPSEILAVYFIVILFDGFSQLSGQLFGKRKLAPVISPNKTIEGALGGSILTIACAAFLFIGENYSFEKIVFLLVACPAALAGDLLASWYKRRTGIKDYSSLIPGHGGVLDRFDSFIAVGALCYLFDLILSAC